MPPPPQKQLRDYLERYRAAGADWNLTGLGGDDKGKYLVPAKDYEKFLQVVHDTIFGSPSFACSLLERHLTCGPILIDLDFKYSAGAHLQRRFTAEQLQQFVIQYAAALYRFMDLSSLNGKPLRFFVMLKPGPEADKNASKHKDGVHIVCPDLTLDPKMQYTLRGYMLQKGCVQGVFDDTGFVNPEQDVFDISVINRNNWFLYGATKPDKNWYKVETIYELPTDLNVLNMGEEGRLTAIREALEEEDLSNYDTWDLMKLLSIRIGHEVVDSLKVDDDRKVEWESLYAKWSGGKNQQIGGNQITTPVLEGEGGTAEPPPLSLENQANEPVFEEPVVGYTGEDIQQASELLEKCLNPTKRAKDYGSWIDLGLCLFNINPEEKMMLRWATFSRRVDGYEATSTETYAKVWRGFQNSTASRKIRMGTLHFWAMEDNNHKYKEITEKTCVGWILGNVDATHVKVATLMKLLYQYEFRCTMTGRKMLDYFQYTGNYWKKLKSPNELRARLANRIVYMYLLAAREVTRLEMVGLGDGEKLNVEAEVKEKTTALHEKGKNINKTVTCLEGAPFKNHVMTECNEKFYDETFTDNLNQRKDIFACGNCVVELRHYTSSDVKAGDIPHVYIRKGRPDDYISFAMGKEKDVDPIVLDYNTKTGLLMPFDPNTPEQKLLADFFEKIFPNDELRHYVLTLLSACLEGENREQKFYIMTGGGGNGKSVLINLMRFVFGEYQTSLNTAALTRRRPESGAANPDIIGLQAKRFIYMQEPDEGEKLNTARIKQFTGNDIVEARGLFADQEKFKIMGRIFFSTNDLPPVNSMDGGTWRRIEVLPFVSAFKPKGHPEIDPDNNIYEMDINLEDKFKQNPVRAAFLRLLLHYWETVYLKDGLAYPPECVLEAINRYKADNDSFVAFAKDTLIKDLGADAALSDIVVRYKAWVSAQPPGRKILKKQELVERLMKTYKSNDGGKTYRDVRVAMDGEDISGNYVA
jgi:P4 family phage/plasmid primase-like protien